MTKKKRAKKGLFQPWEDKIIKERWRTHTDKQIAEDIGRAERGVAERRKKLGLVKKNGRPADESIQDAILDNPDKYNLSKLSKEDRISFYRSQFHKNDRYPQLMRVLCPEELDYYKGKYIATIESMDTCTHQEEDLVHHMIMKEMAIIRIQEQIRDAIEKSREDDDEHKKPAIYLYEQLDKAEKQYITYKEKLHQTREQRLKKGEESKINIANMVAAFQDAENRKQSGRLAGRMEYFASKCKEDMSSMNFLIGD